MKTLFMITVVMLTLGCGSIEDPSIQTNEGQELRSQHTWVEYGPNGEVIDQRKIIAQPNAVAKLRPVFLDGKQSIHPTLQIVLDDSNAQEDLVEVVVSIRSAHTLSVLPKFDLFEKRDSVKNINTFTQRKLVREADGILRSFEREAAISTIVELGGEVIQEFRVGNAIALNITPSNLIVLLGRHPEIYAATLDKIYAPPASDVSDGRDSINSDQLGYPDFGDGYNIGLIDTGVRNTHETLAPDQIGFYRDCAWGHPTTCEYYYVYPYYVYYNAGDPATDKGHGTYMADVIAGDGSGGDAYTGVAASAVVDSVNVYTGTYHDTLSIAAVLRAYNLLDGYDQVILVNVNDYDSEFDDAISTAADDLHDEGVIVIAPAGNTSRSNVSAPANAHKVLAVGAYVVSGGSYSGSNGQEDDGRHKPEIAGPTSIYAASTVSNSAYTWKSGTCTAAAYIAAVAALLEAEFVAQEIWDAAGAVFAAIIAFGDDGSGMLGGYDGAGHLDIAEKDDSIWTSGYVTMDPGDTEYIYIWYSGGERCNLKAAIWWPETYYHAYMCHTSNNLLRLQRDLVNIDSSDHDEYVYEKVTYPGNLIGGAWWRIKIYNNAMNLCYDQVVHYFISVDTVCD